MGTAAIAIEAAIAKGRQSLRVTDRVRDRVRVSHRDRRSEPNLLKMYYL